MCITIRPKHRKTRLRRDSERIDGDRLARGGQKDPFWPNSKTRLGKKNFFIKPKFGKIFCIRPIDMLGRKHQWRKLKNFSQKWSKWPPKKFGSLSRPDQTAESGRNGPHRAVYHSSKSMPGSLKFNFGETVGIHQSKFSGLGSRPKRRRWVRRHGDSEP